MNLPLAMIQTFMARWVNRIFVSIGSYPYIVVSEEARLHVLAREIRRGRVQRRKDCGFGRGSLIALVLLFASSVVLAFEMGLAF